MSFSAALSFQPMLASPPLISCLPAACTPSAPRIPPGQDSAPRALSSLEDQTVVAKQSIQGTTVANCLTQANSWGLLEKNPGLISHFKRCGDPDQTLYLLLHREEETGN